MRTQRGRLCLSEFYCDDRPLLTVQTLNFFSCSSNSRSEPVASVVVRSFTEALPENRYLI